MIPLTSTSSSEFMDAIAVSAVLIANKAYTSEFSQSISVVCRSAILKHIIHADFTDLSRNPLQRSSKSLVRSCEYSSRTEEPIVEWFPVYFDNALKAPPSSVTCLGKKVRTRGGGFAVPVELRRASARTPPLLPTQRLSQ